ncbi:MAG: heparinase II/III family protein [Bacillota bacterium]|nr:heparinase II/III family protein [Bacillota bacterium]
MMPLTSGSTGSRTEKIVRMIFWICTLALLATQVWIQRRAPLHLLIMGLLVITIPLLISIILRLQPDYSRNVSRCSCVALVLISLVYAILAVRTWVTGTVGYTTGIPTDMAGWYSGSALMGCLIYLNAGILSRHPTFRWMTIPVQLLMAVLVFVGGSAQAILWLVIISMTLIIIQSIQAHGSTLFRRMGLTGLVMLLVILAAPLFFANAARRVARVDPLPHPIVAADELSIIYDEAKDDNQVLGYLSYQDIQAIDQALRVSGISSERSDLALQRYLSMRYQTLPGDLLLRDLRQKQFLQASLQSAGPGNWLIGYGLVWFVSFLDPIRQSILQIIAIWGLGGLVVFAAPFIIFLLTMLRHDRRSGRWAALSVGVDLIVVVLLLTLFVFWGGMVLHPLLLLLFYLPLILLILKTDALVETSPSPVQIVKPVKRRQIQLILLAFVIFSVLFVSALLIMGKDCKTLLRQGYRMIYQNNNRIVRLLSNSQPGRWQPTFKPGSRAPMQQYEVDLDENDADALIVGRYKGFVFGPAIDWELPGIDNPSTQYHYHGMFWLDSCLRAWKESQDPRYVQSALDLVFSWIERFPVRSSDDPPYAWNDDSTARRVYYLCDAYASWYLEMTEDQRLILRRTLAYQADLLSQGTFYTWYHNHGLFQDRALLRYTQVIEDPNNDLYRAICKDRIMTYIQKAVTADGVNTEHSPAYHLVVVVLLQSMADFLETVDPSFSHMLREDVIDKMRDYATWLVRPDGQYPPLGDSLTEMEVIQSWLADPWYQFAATAGSTGMMPESLDRVYPDGGYAIFRNSWLFDGQASWVMFVAATHGGSHKHHDDLSFMIWHRGDLFTDGGTGGYDYFGNPLALYGVSPWAHSTLVSNWLDWRNAHFYKYRPLIDDKGLETGITDWSINDGNSAVTGIQKRIAGIEQVRTLTYDKQNNQVAIIDVVTSEGKDDSHLFLFQLAEGIEPVSDEDSIILMRHGQPTATITFSSALPYDVIIRTGDEDPLIQAFRADTGAARTVIGVQFDHVSDQFELVTSISLLP